MYHDDNQHPAEGMEIQIAPSQEVLAGSMQSFKMEWIFTESIVNQTASLP